MDESQVLTSLFVQTAARDMFLLINYAYSSHAQLLLSLARL